jgi:lipoprotein-releasing system permease protein
VSPPATRSRHRKLAELALGIALVLAGAVIIATGDTERAYVSGGAPIFAGLVVILHGAAGLAGYQSFVAWRYLLNYEQRVTRRAKAGIALGVALVAVAWTLGPSFDRGVRLDDPRHLALLAALAVLAVVVVIGVLRYAKPALVAFLIGVGVILAASLADWLVRHGHVPGAVLGLEAELLARRVLGYVRIGGAVIAGLAMFFGCLRAFFTFFTTVPIGGVWIGTAALVIVLSVMSGFETDLREKILGSNAHIQITREDGEFVEWRDVKAKVDRLPGVVASTPYAVSEVVIASNSNGVNVLIKGIDPATVGAVTNLVSYLKEDPAAMERLAPIPTAAPARTAPLDPPRAGALDPPPADLAVGGEPIDFSGSPDSPRSRGARADDSEGASPTTAGSPSDAGLAPEAGRGAPVVDPPPADLATTEDDPVDYGRVYELPDPLLLDLPSTGSLAERTRALPGMLIGNELVKQTAFQVGMEVRVVSPLSDPSNPDATGTPIPFNRDYRVAGVFYTGMYEYDLKYVYVTLESLQEFLDLGDAVDGIEVRVADADGTARYVPSERGPGLVRDALGPGYRVADWRELNRSLFSALKLEKIAMFLVLGIVILVASFSIVGNLIMVVIEKGREIALLKTLGATDFGVTQMFAIQGLLIGLIGTLLGVAVGLLGCWLIQQVGFPLDPDVYYINRLPIHVDWQAVAAAGAAGVMISIAATLYPAFLAARVRPAVGMRH